ncbi:hypothetical protein AX14_011112 [Amanita brunnescens Koide BX004]|nr:hypothetical protein AX14_011112 [Amanita brunnescens Koide BX004]
MQQNSATITDFAIGQDVTGNSQGRHHLPSVNPLRYSDLQTTTEPHSVGEIWANMLHNVQAALAQERGFSMRALTNPNGPEGNVVVRLFIDALTLQPCNPTFMAARDAWIQADQTWFQGIHRCTLYSAFVSLGLGSNAKDDFVDKSVPPDCFR